MDLLLGEASLNFAMDKLYANWLLSMADTQAVGCGAPGAHDGDRGGARPPHFDCCSPKTSSFGCDYTGVRQRPPRFRPRPGADAGASSPPPHHIVHIIATHTYTSPPAAAGSGAHPTCSQVPGGAFNTTRGALPDVTPFNFPYGGWPGDPSWGVAGATIPWEVLVQGGDDSIVQQHYVVSKAVVDFLTSQGDPALGGLVTFGYYGDWLALSAPPKPQVTGWSHLLAMSRLVDMANATGHAADCRAYAALLTKLRLAGLSSAPGTAGWRKHNIHTRAVFGQACPRREGWPGRRM